MSNKIDDKETRRFDSAPSHASKNEASVERNVEARFNSYWTHEPFSGCWLWTGGCGKAGYGMFSISRLGRWIKTYAHRLSWTIYVGPIPSGACVLHRCDTPPCVNPSHLFLGTKGDNTADAFRKGRLKRSATSGRLEGAQ